MSLSAEMNPPDYSPVAAQLEPAVRQEMASWGISGVALALIDDQRIVWAAGFGEAKRESVFRCGSISKLFNAVAVMQLVEAGKLDLDAPVSLYGAELLPVVPFPEAGPVSLRQLLCHRSGMIRESPVGGYFDDTEPGLARTVSSVGQAVLVNPPNTKTRYSNVGPSIAGRVVELVSGERYDKYQHEHILAPLGMSRSAWRRQDVARGQLVPAYLRVADGRGGFTRRRTPVFDLGTIPAGNLFTTAEDLARFVSMLAAGGETPGGRVLKRESLAQMFTAQFPDEPGSFGLGFMVGKFGEHQLVSHSGAVYGHSASLAFLPESKLGVVVLGNEDIANARIQKLANRALSLMLELKLGEQPPAEPLPLKLAPDKLADFAGEYESQSFWASLVMKGAKLEANISGQPVRLTLVEPLRFLADSRVHDAVSLVFERNHEGAIAGFSMGLPRIGVQKFTRVPAQVPAIPRAWRAYLGSYGPAFIPLVISTRHGHLYAMTENLADYRLTPLNRNVFAFPPGLYTDEHLVFLEERSGKVSRVNLANMNLRRR